MTDTLLPTVPERIASDVRFQQAVREGATLRQLHELVGVHLFGRTSVKRARRLVLSQKPALGTEGKDRPGEVALAPSDLPVRLIRPPGATMQVYILTQEPVLCPVNQADAAFRSPVRRRGSAGVARADRKRPPVLPVAKQQDFADGVPPGSLRLSVEKEGAGPVVCTLTWVTPTGAQGITLVLENLQAGTVLRIEDSQHPRAS